MRVGTVRSSFFVGEGKDKDQASFSTDVYRLKNSVILDSGMTIHLVDFKTADPGDYLWAGEHKVPIKGYGTVDVLTKALNKGQELTDRILRIRDVAFYPNFATNPVSLQQLHKRGLWCLALII
jgi:Pol polyprotein